MRSLRNLSWPLVALALVSALVFGGSVLGDRASGARAEHCARNAFASAVRQHEVTGSGTRVAVLGDSYSVGLGLPDPRRSWPSRLPGRVEVFGFSGSGFSAAASPCPDASYVDRVTAAAAAARTVVVEGGLNDFDQSDAAIRSGLSRVLTVLHGRRALVVGPPPAPSRADRVARVDRLLAAGCARAGVAYLSMLDLDLPYLPDHLHLTATGHRLFGDAVSARLRSLR